MQNLLINKKILIDEQSEVFRSTNIVYLLNCLLLIEETVVTLFVPSTFHSDMIKKHVNILVDYFKKPVNIIVDPSIAKPIEPDTTTKQAPLYGYIAQEFIETPFFVGESNKEAYQKVIALVENPSLVFVFGPVGTGKTHLIHLFAYKAHKKGLSVYINTANELLEEIKNHLQNKNVHNFINFLSSLDTCIIDDVQKFNSREINFAHDILFEIINNFILRKKRIVFTSDIPPTSFSYIREAITSRFLTGTVKIEKMDTFVKSQYIEHYCKENDMFIPEDVRAFITNIAQNGRELKFLLNICYFLHTERQLTLGSLLQRIPQDMYQLDITLSRTVFSDLYRILNDYFGISFTTKKELKKRSRISTVRDSILYFLLYNRMNVHELRAKLAISSNNHVYYYEKGKEHFSKLPEAIQNKIKEILK